MKKEIFVTRSSMPSYEEYCEVYIPYGSDLPAMVIELKHNKCAESRLEQIKVVRNRCLDIFILT